MTTKGQANLRRAIERSRSGGSGKGKVLRADDRRCRPHSPEHAANIKRGIARSRWSHAQGALAKEGLPHEAVPMTAQAVEAFDNPVLMRDRPAVEGECHWCYFWDKEGLHS